MTSDDVIVGFVYFAFSVVSLWQVYKMQRASWMGVYDDIPISTPFGIAVEDGCRGERMLVFHERVHWAMLLPIVMPLIRFYGWIIPRFAFDIPVVSSIALCVLVSVIIQITNEVIADSLCRIYFGKRYYAMLLALHVRIWMKSFNAFDRYQHLKKLLLACALYPHRYFLVRKSFEIAHLRKNKHALKGVPAMYVKGVVQEEVIDADFEVDSD